VGRLRSRVLFRWDRPSADGVGDLPEGRFWTSKGRSPTWRLYGQVDAWRIDSPASYSPEPDASMLELLVLFDNKRFNDEAS
jgi:hypothetical protein